MPGFVARSSMDAFKLPKEPTTTPVIMITARSEPALRERVRDSGAMCLLTKPFEASELIACIEQALVA